MPWKSHNCGILAYLWMERSLNIPELDYNETKAWDPQNRNSPRPTHPGSPIPSPVVGPKPCTLQNGRVCSWSPPERPPLALSTRSCWGLLRGGGEGPSRAANCWAAGIVLAVPPSAGVLHACTPGPCQGGVQLLRSPWKSTESGFISKAKGQFFNSADSEKTQADTSGSKAD